LIIYLENRRNFPHVDNPRSQVLANGHVEEKQWNPKGHRQEGKLKGEVCAILDREGCKSADIGQSKGTSNQSQDGRSETIVIKKYCFSKVKLNPSIISRDKKLTYYTFFLIFKMVNFSMKTSLTLK
jgi:hypothetical protein